MLKWKQLNIVQKGIVEQIITYVSIFVVSLLCLGITAYNKDNNYDIDARTSQIQQIASNKKYNHEHKIQQDALNSNSNNTDPILKSILQNKYYNESPLKCIKQFFTIYNTYNSKNDYESRHNKVQNLVTPNILKNKRIFNPKYDGKDGVLSDISSTEMSHGGNNENLLVECHTTTWQPSNTSEDMSESHKHSFGQWYKVTYSLQQRKIINIQSLYTNYNSDSNDFNTTSTTESGSGVYY